LSFKTLFSSFMIFIINLCSQIFNENLKV
jgi:hypothetical protein